MDAHHELTLQNKAYLKTVELYVWQAYKLDHPENDVSTKAYLGSARQTIKAQVRANEDGILAGMQEAEWLLKQLDLKILTAKKDGHNVLKDSVALEFAGRASTVLGVERTLLNLLQRMSGVATKTKKLSLKLPGHIKLLATRKTLWGLLDKRAVSLGGGGTHRLDLSDAILVKDNHLTLTPKFLKGMKRVFKKSSKVRFVEFELESVQEVENFMESFKKVKKYLPDGDGVVVMLDNFTPGDVRKVVRPLKEAGIFVELSGGINERNISRYNIAGVSAISSGAITTKADNLDFSMEVGPAAQ